MGKTVYFQFLRTVNIVKPHGFREKPSTFRLNILAETVYSTYDPFFVVQMVFYFERTQRMNFEWPLMALYDSGDNKCLLKLNENVECLIFLNFFNWVV